MEAISTGSHWGDTFVRGEGPWLYTAGGDRYFDATAGSGAVGLGHQHPAVVRACHRQVDALLHTGCKLRSNVRAELAKRIAGLVPYRQPAVLFAVIGTEAVESAFKIARSYTGRTRIAGLRHAFHGKSREALGITWRASFKAYSAVPSNDALILVPPYADAQGRADAAAVEEALAAYRQSLLEAEKTGQLPAALIFEPIQVTEGVLLFPEAYIEGLLKISREYGVVTILDEIYTSMGRTGTFLFSDTLSVKPDLLLLGKSLGNGLPISLVVGEAEMMNSLPPGVQTSTYSGHPLGCAAAHAVLDVVIGESLWDTAASTGAYLKSQLLEMQKRFPHILSIRQRGMLLAFDLGQDNEPRPELASRYLAQALARNVLLFGGGASNASIKIVPPTLLSKEDTDFLVQALESAFVGLQQGI